MTNSKESLKSFMGRFARDEQGGITIMGLMLLISMLVVGGMAVDFMMFEGRRATLQGVADRSVLAATKLGQEFDTEAEVKAHSQAVVSDYFSIAGQTANLSGPAEIKILAGRRSVNVNTNLNVGTNYLRLIGIDTLQSDVNSSAVEAESNIEISLVLDTSYSMSKVEGTSTRMDLLQVAATDFVNTLLTPELPEPEFKDQISISLISYSSQVSIGDDIYRALNLPITSVELNGEEFENPARCIEIQDAEFSKHAWNTAGLYKQIEYFGMYGGQSLVGEAPNQVMMLDTPTCPTAAGNHIIPMSQNAGALTTAINQLEPYLNTSIQEGMKWGMTLLDPSFRDVLDKIPSIDDAFKGIRPTEYAAPGDVVDTVKYVVLMTDGENANNYRLKTDRYDDAAEILYWARASRGYWNNNSGDRGPISSSNFYERERAPSAKDILLQASCTAAKDEGIIVYAIMMQEQVGVPVFDANGVEQFPNAFKQMRDCASSVENHYFETSAEDVQEAFKAIASQITDLRLSQ